MANFLAYNPEQAYLLPPTVREVLGEGHLCFFVHGAVERLDLRDFEAGCSDEGHPAYHPALLLKVWLYAYALGMTSSRRLEQRIREDLAFRYLAGGAQPDFWALNEFRKRHGRAMNDIFTQVVELARSLGLGKLGHVAIDSTQDSRWRRGEVGVGWAVLMKTQQMTACLAAMVVLLMSGGPVLADDKPTSLADARNAVEANLRTPEGKAYDEKLGKEFLEKHLSTMKQCKPSDGKGLDSFWILMKLDKDGAVKEVLMHPDTKMGTCARETLLKSTFSPPPRPGYWVSVYMKLVH